MIKGICKIRVFMYGSIIMALVLGVYGQFISYYIDDNIVEVSPLTCLKVITMISILLFSIPPICAHKINKKQTINKEELKIYFRINILLGIVTSLWSLFVLIMWLG